MKSICLFAWCPALLLGAHNLLLPQPQKLQYGSGLLRLAGLAVETAADASPEDRFAAQELRAAMAAKTGILPPDGGVRRIRLERTTADAPLPGKDDRPGPEARESYRIRITADGGEVRAASSAGLYYAVQTLKQMMEGEGAGAAWPEAQIEDWPSLAYRGVMIDLSHGPLVAEDEIKRQIDFLARWKGNQYYFYSELSIELKGYPLINPGGRYSQDQVRRVIEYARERHVDVVPCLEFYGHLHDLFRIERYADLGALPHGGDLNPRNPRMQSMVQDWVGQMAALFPSPWFHIGLDEPWELERAGSAAAGGVKPEALYQEHLHRMAEWVRARGKRVLFWADVAAGAALFEKYPEMASHLPAGAVPVPWHYHVEKDFTRMLAPFSKAGVPHVIGTGIWAWDTIVPDYTVTFANIDGFLADARKHGTLGIINTNWADDAQILYRQTLPGIAYGAVAAWQSAPVDRAGFFAHYAARLWGSAAPDIAAALEALDRGQQLIARSLGTESMFRLWDDPLVPDRLERVRAHRDDLRQARLAAEDAQERLQNAAAIHDETGSLASLLVGARLLDYAGMKYLYALELEEVYRKAGAAANRGDVSFWLGYQASSRNHSRIGDLMDLIMELREIYRQAWEAEYTPYRLGTALGRFDAEYQYWRRLQARFWELQRRYKPGTALPPLTGLAEGPSPK